MQHPDYDYMIVMERRRNELAAAEHSRMVKEALAARRANAGPRPSLAVRAQQVGGALVLSLARFLSSAGAWLLNLGCRLQTRVSWLNEGAEHQSSPCA